MPEVDARDCPLTGISPRALEHFERALAEFQSARGDARRHLHHAVAESPRFAMARIFEGYLGLGGRDPAGAAQAARILEEIAPDRLNSREQGHLAALAAAAGGELETASELLGSLLREFPRDALALQVAQTLDYQRGDACALRARVEAVLPAWSPRTPGYHALLSMHAFGLEECGEYRRAEDIALHALQLEPGNLRAHHVIAHVLEMRGRAREGARWMSSRAVHWMDDGPMVTHQWWHFALFQLAAEGPRCALEIYDRHIGAHAGAISDLIDASALLWRLRLRGMELGDRWSELAERWAPHAADAYCAFNDLHAMMAFVGAARWSLAQALLAAQARRVLERGTNSVMTRLVGLPACRALYAFGRGDYARAEQILSGLPPAAHRLGGSQAQRDVLELTHAAALRRVVRGPVRDALRAA